MGFLFSHPIRVELWEESSIPEQEAALERALNAELLRSQANGSRAGDRVVFELVIHSGSQLGAGKKKGGGEDDDEDDNSNFGLFISCVFISLLAITNNGLRFSLFNRRVDLY